MSGAGHEFSARLVALMGKVQERLGTPPAKVAVDVDAFDLL